MSITRVALTYQSSHVLDVAVSPPQLARAVGHYLLRIPLEFSWPSSRQVAAITNLAVRVEVADGSAFQAMGLANSEVPMSLNLRRDGRDRCAVELPLTRLQMLEVEALRNGGDLALRLYVHGLAHGAEQAMNIGTHEHLRVPQSEWIVQLNACGFSRLMILELPDLDGEVTQHPGLIQQLACARSALDRGHYDEVVASCRSALLVLAEVLQDKEAQRHVVDLYKTRRTEMTVDQRERLVRAALENFTQLAHHPGEQVVAPQYSRDQAIWLLALTGLTIRQALKQGGHAARPAL